MVNLRHLLKLKEGVEVWNTWRKGNPHIIPDLRWADLRCAGLGGVSLRASPLIFLPLIFFTLDLSHR